MPEQETITISKAEYQHLVNEKAFLSALLDTGVDSWDGYEAARDLYNNEYKLY